MTKLVIAIFLISFATVASANDGMVSVTGFGTVDPELVKSSAQGRMMAKRAAQMDAQRLLSEQIKGIEIRAGSTVEDYEVKSDIIATRVKTWLKGAITLEEKVQKQEGIWVAEVKMAVCLTNQAQACKNKDTLQAISDEANQL